ncbi:MAG TPA: TonB-dependent receptor [Fodinibius sp.]|nr:TonB-dependent receptor [Fodinibius sp.]
MITTASYAQNDYKVSGVVTDASSGETIPGVNILVKGTTTGTATDAEGTYSLTVPSSKDTLLVSSIGYADQTIPIQGRHTIDISLDPKALLGEEMVVIGYGSQQRQDVTGAISSVSAEDLSNQPVADINQALQGKVSGVQITSNSGAPGGNLMVRIRGTGTINNAGPLYVIDGNPMADPSNLNPNNIQSVEVLKSASAAAIYGSRGANGVVLITTKDGHAGDMQVDYNMYMGVQETPKKLDMTNAQQYAQLYNEALVNGGDDPAFDNPAQFGEGTDWQDAVFRTAPISNFNLAFSGGNERSQYRISTDYLSQNGTIIESKYRKLNFSVNSSHDIKDWLHVGENINYTYSSEVDIHEEVLFGNPIWSTIIAAPTAPVREKDGSWGHPEYSTEGNPVATIHYNHDNITEKTLSGNFFATIDFINTLSLKSQFNINIGDGRNKAFTPVYDIYSHQRNPISQLEQSAYDWTNWSWESTLRYENTFGDHNLNGLLGFTAQNVETSNIYAVGQELPPGAGNNNNLRYLGLSSDGFQVDGGAGEWGMVSLLGRIDYDYQNTYLATINFRRDGSSRFGSNNRWGNFPSFSLGWRISSEPFMSSVDFIDDLKLRGGWGELGNQSALSNYAFVSTLNSNIPYFFGQNDQVVLGQTPSSTANPDLKWETVQEWDFGIDLRMLDDRVTFSGGYYHRKTTDMLVQLPISGLAGLPNPPFKNAGNVVNKGLEFTVGYHKNSTTGFSYDISANISTLNNEVTYLQNSGAAFSSGNVKNANVSRTEVGHPIASFYGYQTDGLFQNWDEVYNHAAQNQDPDGGRNEATAQNFTAPGDIRYKDLNDDGVINAQDRTYIGSPWPDLTYGLSSNFRYQNVDMSFTLSGSYGNEIYAGWKTWTNASSFFNYYAPDMLNSWDGEGSSNSVPRMNGSDPNANIRVSDRFVEDGSYVKLKNIQLGYTLPQSLLNKWDFQRIRIYVSAQNLFTITNYDGMDPEVGMNTQEGSLDVGIDRGIYPQPRTITAGLNVSF